MSLISIGARRWAVWLVTGALLVAPTVGSFSVSVWKDIPYSAMLLFCGAAVLQLANQWRSGDRRFTTVRFPLLLLAAASALAVVIRQNGLFFAVILGTLLIATLTGIRRWLAAGTFAMVGVLVVLKLVVYPIAGVEPSATQLKYASLMHDIAAVVHHHPDAVSADDALPIESMAPLERWSETYSCYTLNPLYYGAGLDFDGLNEDPTRLRRSWLDLVRAEPSTVIGHRLCAASVAWRPMAVDRRLSVLYTVSSGIDPNAEGLETTPLSPTLHRWGSALISEINEPQREWYLWRAATWIYLCYAVLLFAAVRNRCAWLLLPGAPLLAQQLGVSVVNPAQDARYMMGALLLAVLLLPLATVDWRTGGATSAGSTAPIGESERSPIDHLSDC